MNTNLLAIIKRIIAEQGEAILADPQRLKGIVKERGLLKNIGMRACMGEVNAAVCLVNAVYQKPVSFDMTFGKTYPVAMQRMITATRGKGLFLNNQTHDFNELIHIFAAFFCQGIFMLERAGAERFKHELAFQILKQRIKGMKTLSGDFPVNHIIDFLHGRNSFRVGDVLHLAANRAEIRLFGGRLRVFPLEVANKVKHFASAIIGKGLNFFYKQFGIGHTVTVRRLWAPCLVRSNL